MFLLFITLLKSIICVTEFHPLIILSMSVQSVLIPSVLFRPGKWYSCTLNNERLEYLNINFGFQNSDKQQKSVVIRRSAAAAPLSEHSVDDTHKKVGHRF